MKSSTSATKKPVKCAVVCISCRSVLNSTARCRPNCVHGAFIRLGCSMPTTASAGVLCSRAVGHHRKLCRLPLQPAFLAVGISDIRGIENALKLELGSQRLEFSPGSQVGWLGRVCTSSCRRRTQEPAAMDFAFDLRLQGTEQLQVVPVGKTSQVSLAVHWPHPASSATSCRPSARSPTRASPPTGRPRSSPPTWKKPCPAACPRPAVRTSTAAASG